MEFEGGRARQFSEKESMLAMEKKVRELENRYRSGKPPKEKKKDSRDREK